MEQLSVKNIYCPSRVSVCMCGTYLVETAELLKEILALLFRTQGTDVIDLKVKPMSWRNSNQLNLNQLEYMY